MRLSKLLLPLTLACTVAYPVVAQAKPIICTFHQEITSDINRVSTLNSMGIKITIPLNSRAIAKKDGSIQIIDAGTYKFLNCLTTNPGAVMGLGSEYSSVIISKSKVTTLQEGFYKALPGGNKFLSWTVTVDKGYTFYDIKLIIKGSKGVIEVVSPTEGSISSDSEIKEQIDNLIAIANNIDIL